MIRPFLRYPDKRLRTAAAAVGEIDDAVRAIWDDMIETMDAMPGVGLAAPQIGVMQALAVVDASTERGQAVRFANPVLVGASTEFRDVAEGSPNLPGVSAKVSRPDWVEVSFVNADGQEEQRRFDGLWATSIQHQIDHLAGRMYFDRLSRVKREMLIKKARKGGAS